MNDPQNNVAVCSITVDGPVRVTAYGDDTPAPYHHYLFRYSDEASPAPTYLPYPPAPAETVALRLDFQEGPVKESGNNGVQTEDVLAALIHRQSVFAEQFPSRANSVALNHLKIALENLEGRTQDREARGVEGTSAL